MSTKRRLPVLATTPADETPARPWWQWSAFGAGLTMLLWLILAALLDPFVRGLGIPVASALLFHACVEAVASFLVGTVIGRWGPPRGERVGAFAGALAIAFGAGAAVLGATAAGRGTMDLATSLVGGCALLPSSTAAGALGGWVGARRPAR